MKKAFKKAKRKFIQPWKALSIFTSILLVIAFFAVNKIFGKGGMVEKYKEADNEYNKTEIVDNLNLIINY